MNFISKRRSPKSQRQRSHSNPQNDILKFSRPSSSRVRRLWRARRARKNQSFDDNNHSISFASTPSRSRSRDSTSDSSRDSNDNRTLRSLSSNSPRENSSPKRFRFSKKRKSEFSLNNLHKAIKGRNIQMVSSILLTTPELVDKPDNRLSTPLHLAAELGAAKVVSILLLYHADKNAKNKVGLIPLNVAVMNGNQRVADLLSPIRHNHEYMTDEKSKELSFQGGADRVTDSRKILFGHSIVLLSKCHWVGGFIEKIEFQFESRLLDPLKVGIQVTKNGENVLCFDESRNLMNIRKNKVYSWIVMAAENGRTVLSVERMHPKCGLATTIGFSCKFGYKHNKKWVWIESNRML